MSLRQNRDSEDEEEGEEYEEEEEVEEEGEVTSGRTKRNPAAAPPKTTQTGPQSA